MLLLIQPTVAAKMSSFLMSLTKNAVLLLITLFQSLHQVTVLPAVVVLSTQMLRTTSLTLKSKHTFQKNQYFLACFFSLFAPFLFFLKPSVVYTHKYFRFCFYLFRKATKKPSLIKRELRYSTPFISFKNHFNLKILQDLSMKFSI